MRAAVAIDGEGKYRSSAVAAKGTEAAIVVVVSLCECGLLVDKIRVARNTRFDEIPNVTFEARDILLDIETRVSEKPGFRETQVSGNPGFWESRVWGKPGFHETRVSDRKKWARLKRKCAHLF